MRPFYETVLVNWLLEKKIKFITEIILFGKRVWDWTGDDIVINRGITLWLLGITFSFGFAHQVRYNVFNPYIYMTALIILFIGIPFFGKKVEKNA